MPRTDTPAARPNSMGRAGTLWVLLPALVFAVLAGACDNTLGDVVWTSTVDTVTLYSLARPELERESDVLQAKEDALTAANEAQRLQRAASEVKRERKSS